MATLHRKNLSGGLANLTFREVGGVNIAQSKPGRGKVKQSSGTKGSAEAFGYACAAAKDVRLALHPILDDMYDGKMINRLNTAMLNERDMLALQTVPAANAPLLSGFEFNMNSPLRQILRVNIEARLAGGMMEVTIPAFEPAKTLRAGIGWDSCAIRAQSLAFEFERGIYCIFLDEELVIDRTNASFPLNTWASTIPECQQGIAITVLAVELYKEGRRGKLFLNNEMLNPVCIAAAHILKAYVPQQPAADVSWHPMASYNNTVIKNLRKKS